MRIYTIGYGGRRKDEFIELFVLNGIKTVVDIRLRPDKASMGIWTRAKTPDKGIERMLAEAGIGYVSVIELGNVFLEFPDWRERYRQLLDAAGNLLMTGVEGLPEPLCFLCAEKKASDCHRQEAAAYLAKTRGYEVHHIE